MAEDLRTVKERAQAHLAAGRWEAALGDYRSLAMQEPRVPMHRHKLADLLVRLARIPAALDAYEKAATCYAAEGDLLKAIAVSRIILQHDPNHTRTQKALAELYARRKNAPAPTVAPPDPARRTPTVRAIPAATVLPTAPEPSNRRVESGGITLLPPLVLEEPAPKPTAERLHVGYDHDIPNIDLPALPDVESAPQSDGLPQIPLFSQLSRDAFVEFARQVHVRAYPPGAVIVQEGDEGASMFAVVQGSVTVMRKGADGHKEILAQLPEGSFFGEMALMADLPRVATVAAAEESLIMEFTRQKLRDIERQYPSVTRVLERFYRERMLANLLRVSPLLRMLTPEQKHSVAELFKTRSSKPGTVLLHQGQKSDALYLLLRGKCAVLHHLPDGRSTTVGELKEGDVFGEISLMLGTPVTATVRAMTPCIVMRLARANVEQVVLQNPAVRQALIKMGAERQAATAAAINAQQV